MNRSPRQTSPRFWLCVGSTLIVVGFCAWLILTDAPAWRFLVRLFQDKEHLRQALEGWGVLAPVMFILIQALQVVISPIPGEVTGFLGGFLFGQWLGLFYSTIGLTIGSLAAFGVGRKFGTPYVRRFVSQETWDRMGFIVQAEGALLCFVIYLIPGLPKDIVCYLFGLSPMPFRVFAVVSTIGRIPGTWVLSAQGAKSAAGMYIEVALITAVVAAVALPLWYYRDRILSWFRAPVEE